MIHAPSPARPVATDRWSGRARRRLQLLVVPALLWATGPAALEYRGSIENQSQLGRLNRGSALNPGNRLGLEGFDNPPAFARC